MKSPLFRGAESENVMERRDNKNRVKQTLWISPEHSDVIAKLDTAFPEVAEKPLSERIAFYNAFLLQIIQNVNKK